MLTESQKAKFQRLGAEYDKLTIGEPPLHPLKSIQDIYRNEASMIRDFPDQAPETLISIFKNLSAPAQIAEDLKAGRQPQNPVPVLMTYKKLHELEFKTLSELQVNLAQSYVNDGIGHTNDSAAIIENLGKVVDEHPIIAHREGDPLETPRVIKLVSAIFAPSERMLAERVEIQAEVCGTVALIADYLSSVCKELGLSTKIGPDGPA